MELEEVGLLGLLLFSGHLLSLVFEYLLVQLLTRLCIVGLLLLPLCLSISLLQAGLPLSKQELLLQTALLLLLMLYLHLELLLLKSIVLLILQLLCNLLGIN